MFSYRHAFHAGNHADVFKHTVLVAALQYLVQKDTALAMVDTHAGTGLYRLDGDFAQTSHENLEGITQLLQVQAQDDWTPSATLEHYLNIVQSVNAGAAEITKRLIYPGSPAIMQAFMRPQDQLHLFELQPADMRALQGNMQQGRKAAHTHVWHEDSWQGSLRLLPPPSRRGLVLCDPSYEMKSDYMKVAQWLEAALRKFATGTYLIWYPVIPRPEAHELPRKLKSIARQAGKEWLHATLSIKSGSQANVRIPGQKSKRTGMVASGMMVINPPYSLKPALQESLPQLVKALGQDHFAAMQVESGK